MGRKNKNKNKNKNKPKQEVNKEVKEDILVAEESINVKEVSKKEEETPKNWKTLKKPTSSNSLKFCHNDAYENDFPQLGVAKTKKRKEKCNESKNKSESLANVAEGEQNGILVTETNISPEQQLDNNIEEKFPKKLETMVWYVKNPKTKKYQVEERGSQQALPQPKKVQETTSTVNNTIIVTKNQTTNGSQKYQSKAKNKWQKNAKNGAENSYNHKNPSSEPMVPKTESKPNQYKAKGPQSMNSNQALCVDKKIWTIKDNTVANGSNVLISQTEVKPWSKIAAISANNGQDDTRKKSTGAQVDACNDPASAEDQCKNCTEMQNVTSDATCMPVHKSKQSSTDPDCSEDKSINLTEIHNITPDPLNTEDKCEKSTEIDNSTNDGCGISGMRSKKSTEIQLSTNNTDKDAKNLLPTQIKSDERACPENFSSDSIDSPNHMKISKPEKSTSTSNSFVSKCKQSNEVQNQNEISFMIPYPRIVEETALLVLADSDDSEDRFENIQANQGSVTYTHNIDFNNNKNNHNNNNGKMHSTAQPARSDKYSNSFRTNCDQRLPRATATMADWIQWDQKPFQKTRGKISNKKPTQAQKRLQAAEAKSLNQKCIDDATNADSEKPSCSKTNPWLHLDPIAHTSAKTVETDSNREQLNNKDISNDQQKDTEYMCIKQEQKNCDCSEEPQQVSTPANRTVINDEQKDASISSTIATAQVTMESPVVMYSTPPPRAMNPNLPMPSYNFPPPPIGFSDINQNVWHYNVPPPKLSSQPGTSHAQNPPAQIPPRRTSPARTSAGCTSNERTSSGRTSPRQAACNQYSPFSRPPRPFYCQRRTPTHRNLQHLQLNGSDTLSYIPWNEPSRSSLLPPTPPRTSNNPLQIDMPMWNFTEVDHKADEYPRFLCQFDDIHYLRLEQMAIVTLKLAFGNTKPRVKYRPI